MPTFADLPEDFSCPYRHGCPYLEGLSTQAVFRRYQDGADAECQYEYLLEQANLEIAELKDEKAQLTKERDQFQAQLHALQRSQFKQPPKPPPPATPPDDSKPPKKRGAKPGHPPWQRAKPTRIDRVVPVPAPCTCPHCQATPLQSSAEIREHIQEDIVLEPRTVVTSFQHSQAWCPQCECLVSQTGPGELPGAYIGPVAKATAAYMRQELNVPYRKISRFFADFFGLKFVPASAYGFDRQAARRGAPLYEDLRQKIQALKVAHADETSWRHDGNIHWVWYAGNQDLACFVWDAHRSGEAAQNLLGENFQGVLVADGLASYNAVHPKDRQSCLAHIHRAAEDLDKELALLKGQAQDPQARQMCEQVQGLIKRACASAHPSQRWDARKRKRTEKAFRQELNEICSASLVYPRAEKLRQRLIGPEQKEFFTFLRHRGVPPTNNEAERSLRPVVIMRKVIQGTRSAEGLKNHSVLRSLMETAKRQGKKVRETFQALFTEETKQARKALYRESS